MARFLYRPCPAGKRGGCRLVCGFGGGYTLPMRNWLFHPVIFYPLVLIFAAVVILASLSPQTWPRPAVAQAGLIREESLVLERDAFTAPAPSPDQHVYVTRDLVGNAQALRVAVLPDMPAPTPAEQGVRVLLTPESAAMLNDRPVIVEVTYRPVSINAATGLAVSLQGIGPADWQIQPIAPQSGTVRYQFPPSFAINAIGLRAISEGTDQAYGVEIVRIRAIPHTSAVTSD